ISLLLHADEFGRLPNLNEAARLLDIPFRKFQQLLTRLSKWWRIRDEAPEIPDETEEVPCGRCKGLATLPMSEIATPEFDPLDPINRVKCWACDGSGKMEALKESSSAKALIYPDMEQ